MIKPVFADTDVLVAFLRSDPRAKAFMEVFSERINLSTIVVAELLAGVRGDAERATLDDFLSLFPVFPVTLEIARIAGLYRRHYGPTHDLGLTDAILAATTKTGNAELKTLHPERYPMFEVLEPAWAK